MTAEAARTLLEVGALLYNENTGLDGEVVGIGQNPDLDSRHMELEQIGWRIKWEGLPSTIYLFSNLHNRFWEGIQCTSLPSPVDEED